MEINLKIRNSGHALNADKSDPSNANFGKLTPRERIKGEVIGKIISSSYYVLKGSRIEDVSKILHGDEHISCFGVVDKDMNCLGVVLRKDLFDLLGQPYGRDLYRNKGIEMVMKKVPSFSVNKNIYSVSEEIKEYLCLQGTEFFNIFDAAGKFAGIFSTKDMLVYLSEITTKEIQMAHRIQSSITKEESHFENASIEVACASKMAKGIGGDYYYVEEYVPRRWIFSLCDVSGKGISASLVSTVMGGMFSIYDFNAGIPGFISKLNNYILNTFESDKFVTSVVAEFNEETGLVTLYDMGHSIVFIFRKGKLHKINLEEYGTVPFGVTDDIHPVPARFFLQTDDIFLIMSDGIEEQINDEDEYYGQQRVQSLMIRNRFAGLSVIKKALYEDVDKFREGTPQHDDMTVLMIRYKGGASAVGSE